MSEFKLNEAPLTFVSGQGEEDSAPVADTLGVLPYANALKDFIVECDTPMSIGIQGDWGIGKTSLMNMLRGSAELPGAGLLQDQHCRLVNFETWPHAQFNSKAKLALACLRAIMTDVAASIASAPGVERGAVEALVASAEQKLDQVLSGEKGLASLDASSVMLGFRSNFGALVALWADSSEGRRVVVFVDDLDRVPPVDALGLLEAIKNFLEVPGCVFVLAVDYDVVQQGMTEKLGKSVQKTSGKAFYDKIIQLPFVMPSSSYRIDRYIQGLLPRTGFTVLADPTPEDAGYYVEITQCTVGRNPRNIKRVMNYSNLLERIRRPEHGPSDEREARILYALVCMQIAWPELFAHFVNDPTVDTITSLGNWDYLDNLPEAQPLLDRVTDREGFKNNVSTFFDTLFSVLDENDDGQIDSKELEPVVDVMTMARMTAVEGRERPRDFFVRRVRENNAGKSALIDTFLENVFMKSVWYLGSECHYRRSGGRYVTIVHNGKQVGSLVSLRSQPFVFRLAMSPEKVAAGLKEYWSSKHAVRKEAITLARSMFDREASLTGFGDTVIDFSKMTNMPAKDAIGMMNALFRIVTGDKTKA
ncbi:MAG: P-loop NTPase fold protein [Xanthomonadales bacterium]|nr:P-loop NTPase fold protein [Xanthomonadales bacterium]